LPVFLVCTLLYQKKKFGDQGNQRATEDIRNTSKLKVKPAFAKVMKYQGKNEAKMQNGLKVLKP
jgi:hypothetical protein